MLTDTADMKIVEVFEVSIIHCHIFYLKTCVYKFLYCSLPCIVIVKKSTDGGYISFVQVANTSCYITHGIHHKAIGWLLPLSLKEKRESP